MKVTAIESKIKMLKKRRDDLQIFLESAINGIMRKRGKELQEIGINVKRPEVAKFIEKFRKTKMEALGENELEAIENQIRGLNESLKKL